MTMERENNCFGRLIKKDIPPMSTEQAIEVLHELDGCIYDTQQVALDMAIKALEQETVSKETYDREHFARKEAEQKFWDLKRNCIEIPKDASNGDMIKAMFPNVEMVRQEISSTSNNIVVRDNLFLGAINRFHADWWNAPYKRGGEE